MLFAVLGMGYAMAQAEIKFDKTTADVGTFSEESPVVSCVFTFTNIGDAPLVIHQAVASCGCTVPEYTQEPVLPGKTGTIKVTYNGTGKYHAAYQCQDGADAPVHRRRHDRKGRKITANTDKKE